MAKTIVGELVDLYVKYGGSRDDLKGTETTAQMLDAIEQIIETGGGNNDFVVTYTAGVGADKTFAEISAAYEAGKNIKAKTNSDGADIWFLLQAYVNEEGNGAIVFINTIINSDVIDFTTISHTSSDGTEAISVDTASATRTS